MDAAAAQAAAGELWDEAEVGKFAGSKLTRNAN